MKPVTIERLRKVDRYLPAHPPYKMGPELGAIDIATYSRYAEEVLSYLGQKKPITLRESYYLYFLSRILNDLGLTTISLDLDAATSRCRVLDASGVSSQPSVSLDILGDQKITKVNWRFLPNPENLSARDLIEILKSHFSQYAGSSNLRFEIERIEFALTLKPKQICVGLEEFSGYYAFVFDGEKVLFECPAYGNAAYVIKGDWRVLSQQYKAQLERKGVRVIHSSSHLWSWRISQALKSL